MRALNAVLRCDQCDRRVAERRDGVLKLVVRHDQEYHVTHIAVAELTAAPRDGNVGEELETAPATE